jgi:hypothetical protein
MTILSTFFIFVLGKLLKKSKIANRFHLYTITKGLRLIKYSAKELFRCGNPLQPNFFEKKLCKNISLKFEVKEGKKELLPIIFRQTIKIKEGYNLH